MLIRSYNFSHQFSYELYSFESHLLSIVVVAESPGGKVQNIPYIKTNDDFKWRNVIELRGRGSWPRRNVGGVRRGYYAGFNEGYE